MRRWRVLIGVVGLLLVGFGVLRLLTEVPAGDLFKLALWLAVAIVVHDLVLSPTVLATGALVVRLPPRGRRWVQVGLVAAALLTVVALPLVAREGTGPAAEAILQQDYRRSLALLIVLVMVTSIIGYLGQVFRDRRPAGPSVAPAPERESL